MPNGQFSLKKGLKKMGKKKEGKALKKVRGRWGRRRKKRGLLIRTEKYSKHMDSGALGKAKRGSWVI